MKYMILFLHMKKDTNLSTSSLVHMLLLTRFNVCHCSLPSVLTIFYHSKFLFFLITLCFWKPFHQIPIFKIKLLYHCAYNWPLLPVRIHLVSFSAHPIALHLLTALIPCFIKLSSHPKDSVEQ